MNLKIIVPSYETKLEIPYYVMGVAAGFPSPADDFIEKQLDLNDHLIGNKDATFFVRVTGDSMINAGIFDNDLLTVDKSLEARHNSIVIAIINDEFTVKRLKINKDGSVVLMPENEKYQPIILNELEELAIWGVVTNVIRSFA